MNSFAVFFLALITIIVASVDAKPWFKNPLLKKIKRETRPKVLKQLRALRQNVRDKGCDVNLCFALQGDDFITDKEFQDQKDFVDLMVAILTTDEPGNYCAVQYGRTTYPISPLTFKKSQFLRNIQRVRKIGGLDTNIAGALAYTGFQLRPRVEDANKIIILGDGLESVGFRPKRIAKRVHKDGIDISAVAVGGASYPALKEIVGYDKNKVVEIDEFFELAEIVVGLVTDVCGFKGFFF